MASSRKAETKPPKRVLNFKSGKSLEAVLPEESSDEDTYDDTENIDELKNLNGNWTDIQNGVEVYDSSVGIGTTTLKTTLWSNERRAQNTFTENVKLPDPSLFVTDIFEVCIIKSNESEVDSAAANPLDDSKDHTPFTLEPSGSFDMVLIRVNKPEQYTLNEKHSFYAKVFSGAKWRTKQTFYKDGAFWFRAERVLSFFIYAESRQESFVVSPSGTTFTPRFDKRIELDFKEGTVQQEESMKLKMWPSSEEQLSVVKTRGDDQCITAITDTVTLDYKASKLHHSVGVTLPFYGNTEVEKGEEVYLYCTESDSSDIQYEKLEPSQYSISNGNVRVKQKMKKGKRNGVVKTKAKNVRIHEVLELSKVGYLCQILYFKLSGGTETGFELWIECARKEDVPNVRMRNKQNHMTEFPMSCSDDIPLYDQDNISIIIRGAVKIRGSKKVTPEAIHMKFLAVSTTTHARIALVKQQKIDDAYFAEVNISFARARGRQPIKAQLEPWGRVLQPNRKSSNRAKAVDDQKSGKTANRLSNSPENECFKEQSLQALALAIPMDKVKMLGRELLIENDTIERMLTENNRDYAELAISILLYWKKNSNQHTRYDQLVNALKELQLENLSKVFEAKFSENALMRASDFRGK